MADTVLRPDVVRTKKNQDRKEVAAKQRHEIDYIVEKLRKSNPDKKILRSVIKDVIWNVGKSRVLIYEVLRKMGFVVPGKFDKRMKKKLKEILAKMGIA